VDGQLVGFAAVWPIKFIYKSIYIEACAGGDTMVLKEYRGKGIFTRIARKLLNEVNHRKLYFRYSAPGKMSYQGYIKKLNHQSVATLPYWIKVSPANYIKQKLGHKNSGEPDKGLLFDQGGMVVTMVNSFSAEHDAFWEKTKDNMVLGILKSAAYLNWRYARHPLYSHTLLECRRRGELTGYAVIRGCNLLELCSGGSAEVCRALLVAADNIWNKENSVMRHGWFLGEPLLERELRENGWLKYDLGSRPFGLYPAQPLICYVNPGIEQAKAALKKENWRFSMGDVDCM
jgi:hypothetical protein